MKWHTHRGILAGSFALVAGLGVGALGTHIAVADSRGNRGQAPAPVYETNESGESYGSGLDAISRATQPDLIRAYGTDLQVGYVRPTDLYGPEPRSLQEADAMYRSSVGRETLIPLYSQDGKTVIGTFRVSAGSSVAPLD